MSLGFFLDEFSQRIKGERQREYDRLQREDEREFQLLSVLAQHGTPEVQGMAGTAMLEMARGGEQRRRSKGLRGFLGEMERSPYLPQVMSFLDSQREVAAPPASPGAAALPAGAPVEPGAAPIPRGLAPPPEPGGTIYTPTIPGSQFEGPAAQQASAPSATVPPEPLAARPHPGMQPVMAPPEPRVRALFPTAEELAVSQARGSMQGRVQAMVEQMRLAGASDLEIREAMMGMAGAPRRAGQQKPYMIEYYDQATGQRTRGLGSYNAMTGEYTVNGIPVQGISAQQIVGAPRGPNAQLRPVQGAGGELYYEWFIPPTPGTGTAVPGPSATAPAAGGAPPEPGVAVAPTVPTNRQAPDASVPPVASGTVEVQEANGKIGIYERNRQGGLGNRLGTKAPPQSANQKSELTKQYTGWLNTAKVLVQQRSRDRRGRRVQVDLDAIAKEASKIPTMTWSELEQGAQGLGQEKSPGLGLTQEQMDAIVDRLLQGATQGSKPPPEPR